MTDRNNVRPDGQPDHFSHLDAVLRTAFDMLARGAAREDVPAALPVLATVAADRTPEARIVVIRSLDESARTITVHADTRSGKIGELEASPRAALHVYDPGASIQIRLACEAVVHRDGSLWEQAWADKGEGSRYYYQVKQTPGEPITDPEKAAFDAESTQGGKQYFAVLELRITAFEWLYISDKGHRRARFDWRNGQWQGCWLVP